MKPVFCVVLSDGERWSVEAEWPDGTIEYVDTFGGYSDAVNWISTRSEKRLVPLHTGRAECMRQQRANRQAENKALVSCTAGGS
jgi:hypothetical protein